MTARGFTFVEILAAMLFMALAIPVTYQAVLTANQVGVAGARKRIATQLADRILTEMVATDEWRGGDLSGDFADEQPGYRWELYLEEWEEETQQLITTRVYYMVQEREYSVELSTIAPTEEPAA